MSSLDYSKYAPDFEIELNGTKNEEIKKYVSEITVTEDIKASAQFNIVVRDQFDAIGKKFLWLENPDICPGATVSLRIGYANRSDKDHHLIDILTEGLIENITTSGFSQSDSPTTTLQGFHRSKGILNEHPNPKDGTTTGRIVGSQIINKIKDKCNLRGSIIDANLREFPTHITRLANCTYGEILRTQQESIGWIYFITRENIHYINPRKNRDPKMSFEWGKNLVSFVPRLNASNLVTGISLTSTHRTSHTPIKAKADAGEEETWEQDGIKPSELAKRIRKIQDLDQSPRQINTQCDTQEEADAYAKAALNIAGDELLTAECQVVGVPELEIGQMVQMDGLGKMYSGKYFVYKVINKLSTSGYLTTFSVRRNVVKA